ncbi:TPA: hypothetical protein NQO09_002912 [Pseudomonas aeruginosa]|uniref:hypothetical protein n=1 Tax=Pseudomonas aeruginosa TaxID=287 RepID=UPI0032E4416C|nr:hypothetical protein [Pseudomonas aeruginosa]
MSEPRKQAGPRTFSLITIVQWVWLVSLSVLIAIGWRPSSTDAGSQMWEAVTAHLKAFETRISALEESNQARLVQAPSATQQALQGLRETLEARLERLEQPAGEDTFSVALDVLRSEVEMLKGQLTALKSAAASPPKTSKTVRPARQAVAKEEPLPFRVLGTEWRAGRLSVSVAPAEGALAASTIQVVLPGESLGKWRLESVDGNAALFRAGEQTRRLVLP